jgi:hypothetical protein
VILGKPATWVKSGDIVSVTSSAPLSNETTWVSGVALTTGDIRFDATAGKDYILLVDLADVENTLSPSDSVASTDEAIASRWTFYRVANAYRPFDSSQLERTTGSSPLWVQATVSGATDGIALCSVKGATSVTVTVTQAGQTTLNLTEASAVSGDLASGFIRWSHDSRNGATYRVTLTGGSPEIGEIAPFLALDLGVVRPGVTTDPVHYSIMDFDETYGAYTYVKRGYSRKVSGKLGISDRKGFWVEQQLLESRAVPLIYDLNGTLGSEPGRIYFGIVSRASRIDTGLADLDELDFEITGLAEETF